MLCLGLIVLFAGANLALPSSKVELFDLEKAAEYFEQFIIDFGREYKDEEEKSMRFENFKEFLKIVNERNIKNGVAVHGITMFADYTTEEKMYLTSCHFTGGVHTDAGCTNASLSSGVTDVPEAFDWRDENVVSPVKDQKFCGSCWAFSSVGNLESAFAMNHGEILDLSEQQLVDCDAKSKGCAGAKTVDAGLSAFLRLGGAMTEADYPYVAQQHSKCTFDKSKVKAKVVSCTNYYAKGDTDVIKKILHELGPLSIGVYAESWDSYTGGVMKCEPDDADHAVLLVGYGSEKGQDYWIIKNSWGPDFGEQGYIRVDQKFDCGLSQNSLVDSVAE